MKKPLVIILLGPPASGKGTQAKKIKEKFNLEYIGSGNLLRARIKKNDYTGKKIGDYVNEGKRVPTPVIFKIWMEEFSKIKKKKNFKGIIVDGSPRTVYEAKMMEIALEWYDWNDNKKVFFVDLNKREVLKRIKKRRICSNCNLIVAGEEKICPKCKGKLVTREDDTASKINVRWDWYKKEVKPTVKFYEKNNGKNFFVVNGNQSVEDVFKDINKKI